MSVWAPGVAVKLLATVTILFATKPSVPSQASGKLPGVAGGINCVVCGGWESTCTATEIGRSVLYAFSDGDTRVLTVMFPAPPMVLKV